LRESGFQPGDWRKALTSSEGGGGRGGGGGGGNTGRGNPPGGHLQPEGGGNAREAAFLFRRGLVGGSFLFQFSTVRGRSRIVGGWVGSEGGGGAGRSEKKKNG